MASVKQLSLCKKNKTSGILQLKTIPLLDHLQGELFLYVNNDKTPLANSDYRLFNCTLGNQDGSLNGTGRYLGGYEFLLANDVGQLKSS